MKLSDTEWRVFNRKVRRELRAGKGVSYPDGEAFLRDLKRCIGSCAQQHQS